jgi:PAS domain S-box-containing protein
MSDNKRSNSLAGFDSDTLKDIISVFPDGLIITSTSGRIMYHNENAEKIFGYNSEEFSELNAENLINDDYNSELSEEYKSIKKAAVNPGKIVKLNLKGINKDKKLLFLNVTASCIQISGEPHIILAVKDFTERKKYKAEHEYLSQIINHSNDAIIGITKDYSVVSWNKGAERMYGFKEQEMIGKNVSVIVPPERMKFFEKELNKVFSGETMDVIEVIRVTKSGQKLNVLISNSPIYDEYGNIKGASVIATDITLEKKMFDTMIKYISEAVMRLRNPSELVRINLINLVELLKKDALSREDLLIHLQVQIKNTEQITHNLRELTQTIIGSYNEIPAEYREYFDN